MDESIVAPCYCVAYMFIKILKPTLIVILYTAIFSVQALESDNIWIALHIEDRIHTSEDIIDYIENTELSRSDGKNRIELFKMAKGNLEEYGKIKRKWLSSRFKSALKKFTYMKMFEADMFRKKLEEDFYPKQKKVREVLSAFEDATLSKYLNKKYGIMTSHEFYGSELRKMGWPHRKTEHNRDIYLRWRKFQEKRIKEELRFNSIQNYAISVARKNNLKRRGVDSIDVAMFVDDTGKEVRRIFENELNPDVVMKTLMNNEAYKIFVKSLKFISMKTTAMKVIHEYDRDQFYKLKEFGTTELRKKLNKELIDQIMNYENFAWKIMSENRDREELVDLARASYLSYRNTGNFVNFILSGIYRAISDVTNRTFDRKQVQDKLTATLEKIFITISKNLMIDETYLAQTRKELTFDKIVMKELRESSDYKDTNDPYLKGLLNVSFNLVRLHAIKVAASDPVRPVIKLHSQKSRDVFNASMKYLRALNVKKGLDKLEKKIYSDLEHSLCVSPDYLTRYKYDDFMKFIGIKK